MRAIIIAALVVLTTAHIALFAHYWPHSCVIPDSLTAIPESIPLTSIALGFSVATGLITLGILLKATRWYRSVYVCALGVAAFFALRHSPIGKLVELSPSLAGIFGACIALAIGWTLRSKPHQPLDNSKPQRSRSIPWLVFFLIALNFFLAFAPLSDMVPTGIQENGWWTPNSFQLSNKDSVGIKDNLIFVAIRAIAIPIVGHSILINSLVSMIVCAFGIACLVKGIQSLVGPATALLALLFIVTEGWVLTSAYSANLTVTLIANAGLLFYILSSALSKAEISHRRQTWITMFMILTSCLLSLYSYAAVRIPWVLSIATLALVYIVTTRGSLLQRCSAPLIRLVMPIAAAIALVWAVGYKGDFAPLKKDLLVSWPKDSVIAHPVSGELEGFVLIHNPDTPIWKQVARPASGDNLSLIWTRTPSETVRALLVHAGHVLKEHPRFFFLPPLVFLLATAALFRLPWMERPQQTTTLAVCLWAVIWISSFLSVPDPVAYRRGIAFSAIVPILAALAFAPRPSAKGLAVIIPFLLGAACAIIRLPDQLRFSNEPETRARMFTVCGNSFAVRTILKSASVPHATSTLTHVALAGTENPREVNCLTNATRSNEWQRIFPGSSMIGEGQSNSIEAAVRMPPPSTILLYCSPDSMRQPTVGAICNGALPSTRIVETIPVVYGGVSDRWVIFSNIKDSTK
ncbi:MAG: hypothetical protein RL518_2792 [Pseudomonadota bacterium]|jgi:hypothetical protein